MADDLSLRELSIHLVRLPLRQPWRTAYGVEECVETVLVRAVSATHTVWVESCPLARPLYLPEWATGAALLAAEVLGPLVLRQAPATPEAVAPLLAGVRGNEFAKAAIEFAYWGLAAAQAGQALRERLLASPLLAHCPPAPPGPADLPAGWVPYGEGLGRTADLSSLLAATERLVQAGCRRLKLKIAPDWDLAPLTALRSAFPHLPLRVDCNGSYTLAQRAQLQRLDDFGLEMIEQPLYYRDLAGHAELRATLRTPICLDESICSLHDAQEALRLGAASLINLKPARVGGLGPSLSILTACRQAGVGVWVGGMLESGLGLLVALDLAAVVGGPLTHDLSPSGHFHAVDLLGDSLRAIAPGCLAPPTGPYPGLPLDEALVARHTLRAWHLRA